MNTDALMAYVEHTKDAAQFDTIFAYIEQINNAAAIDALFAYVEYIATGDPIPDSTAIENWDALTPPAITGWTITQVVNTGTASTWVTSSALYHSSARSVMFNSHNATTGNKSRLVRTAAINMTTLSPQAFFFNFWLLQSNTHSGNNDTIQVQVSTDGGTTWIDIGSPIPRYNANLPSPASSTYGWTQFGFDLSAYSAQTALKIALLGTSTNNGSDDIYIDDLRIGQATVIQIDSLFAYAEVATERPGVDGLFAYAEVNTERVGTDGLFGYAEVVAGQNTIPVFGPRWQ